MTIRKHKNRTCRHTHGVSFSAASLRMKQGFTFVELLAAIVFVAIVIPVAVRGITIANRAGVFAERQRIAAELADKKLTELTIADEWRYEREGGDFGEEWKDYRYIFKDEAWEMDTMRLVTVEVFFSVQNQEHSIRLSTLVAETEE